MATKPEDKIILIKPDVLEDWLRSLDVSEPTRRAYRRGLGSLEEYVLANGLDFDALEAKDLVAFKQEMLQHLSPGTVSTYLIGIRSFYSWAENDSFANIAAKVKGPATPKGFKKDILTSAQVKRMLKAVEGDSILAKRNYAILNLMVRTGLRDVEVVRANIGDIVSESGYPVLYVHGKGRSGKDEFVLLTDKALEPIEEYLKERPDATDGSPLFVSHSKRNSDKRLTTRTVSGIAKDAMRAIGLDDKRHTAHSLRHTAVTFSLMGGAKVEEAKEMARHSSLNTTMGYAHHVNRLRDAAERRIETVLDAD